MPRAMWKMSGISAYEKEKAGSFTDPDFCPIFAPSMATAF